MIVSQTNYPSNSNDFLSLKFSSFEAIGSGIYGDVYKVVCRNTGEYKALKKLKHNDTSQGINTTTLREVIILRDLKNKNVVQLLDVFIESQMIIMVFEYMKVNLNSIIKVLKYNDELQGHFNFTKFFLKKYREQGKSEDEIKAILDEKLITRFYNHIIQYIFKQLIEGLNYIHNKQVIHRDIKPANILFHFEEDNFEEFLFKEFQLLNDMFTKNKDTKEEDKPENQPLKSNVIEFSENKENRSLVINTPEVKPQYHNISTCTPGYEGLTAHSTYKVSKSFQELKVHSMSDKFRIKYADFGLARLASTSKNNHYTKNMVTQIYRSPEILLYSNLYDKGVDVWSLGCVFAEIIIGFPIFQGENEIDQLNKIFAILGTPHNLFEGKFKLQHFPKINFKDYIKKFNKIIDENAIDLIEMMLKSNPSERITAKQACRVKYFKKSL